MSQQSTVQPEAGQPDGKSLIGPEGRTSIADSVVAKIAGIAAREIAGVHEMGAGAARAVGTIRDKLPGGGGAPSPTQGVRVEVGERQAAVDLDLVVEYGVSIPDVAQSVRRNVIDRLQRMTGLEVSEVNIAVDDIFLGDDADEPEEPRVQ
ncbi:MAG: Asp23/Gls24 family envelope stress response protein [Actinomycetota bacterium]|nr:Asp23/Gls24 family envelope stress response protein [Actinomycetota bacterium]